MRLSEPTTKTWMKVDPYYQQQKCRSMTLVSGGKRFVRIFAEPPRGGGIKRQWGCWQRQFLAFSTAIFSDALETRSALLYGDMQSVVGFSWSQNAWPWMTLTGYFVLNSVFAPVLLPESMRLRKIIVWKLIKIDTYCRQCKSSAWTLVSGNIRFVRIFGRVL